MKSHLPPLFLGWQQRDNISKPVHIKPKISPLLLQEVSEKMCLFVIWVNRPFYDAPMQQFTVVPADITFQKQYWYQYNMIFTAYFGLLM